MTQPTPWRTTCEQALRRFSDADSIRFWGIGHEVDGTYQPIFNYRFEHTYAVVLLARWLAPATGADPEVVECAAWLHDVAKRLKAPHKIGAASLIHFGCISGAFQPITTGEILRRGVAWLDLARGITACFNTEPARAEGRRRLAFIEAHYAQLRREWSDPMEVTPP